MTDEADHQPSEPAPEERREGLGRSDVLAVFAVSSILAAVGLTTFFLTAALTH